MSFLNVCGYKGKTNLDKTIYKMMQASMGGYVKSEYISIIYPGPFFKPLFVPKAFVTDGTHAVARSKSSIFIWRQANAYNKIL